MLPRTDDPGAAADRTLSRAPRAMAGDAATLTGRLALIAYRVGLVVVMGVGLEGLRRLNRSDRARRVDD